MSSGTLVGMTDILCMIVGHREFRTGVLDARPWENLDIHGYSPVDFRESECLRCGQALEAEAA